MVMHNTRGKTEILKITKIIPFLILSLINASLSHAQSLEIPSSLNPVGSGARAIGMGGAFIAIADDATAASWNPAGLVQLEKPEISAVGSFFYRHEEYDSGSHPELENNDNSFNHTDLNYLSAAYPFTVLNRNIVISLNHQMLFDLNKKANFKYTFKGPGVNFPGDIFYKQNGELTTLSPAIAFQITPDLSLGATFNFWTNIFGTDGWTTKYRQISKGTIGGDNARASVRIDTHNRFRGFNYHIGALWNITNKITFGAVYKSSFNSRINRRTKFHEEQSLDGVFSKPINTLSHEQLRLKMPDSYGVAFSYRFSDNFTTAIDLYRTEWSKYILTNDDGSKVRAVNLKSMRGNSVKPTHQIRVGGEYLFILPKTVIPVRGGIFYDPEPSTNNPDDYFGVSCGTGLSIGNIVFDAAYSYRFGRNVDGLTSGVPGSTIDVNQHILLLSTIIHF